MTFDPFEGLWAIQIQNDLTDAMASEEKKSRALAKALERSLNQPQTQKKPLDETKVKDQKR
jgi:hypothetical protein